jgi:alcohol oxidase
MTSTGSDGPIYVSRSYTGARDAEDETLEILSKYHNVPEITDLQNFHSSNAVQRLYRYVGPGGRRSDATHAYLHPLLEDGKHKNIFLLLNTKVQRVVFENKRAVGVEYIHSTEVSTTSSAIRATAKARKLVVVSGGTLGSPQILERSGIGSSSLLKKLDIPVVADLPGVGETYQGMCSTNSIVEPH